MNKEKRNLSQKELNPFDAFYKCLSYCNINAKGIDKDCENTCIERHLKDNL
tara:strand:- start:1227 stop:1379 length:153 start_codon:yes stop_codon:yes gene_type:complete